MLKNIVELMMLTAIMLADLILNGTISSEED